MILAAAKAGIDGLLLVLSVLGTLLGLAGLLGGGYAWFTYSKGKALIDLWEEEARAQKERGDRLDKDCAENKQRLSAAEAAVKVLSEQVSGRQAIEQLRADLGGWRREINEQHAETHTLLTSWLRHLIEKDQGGPLPHA